jgi:hypothetical protein
LLRGKTLKYPITRNININKTPRESMTQSRSVRVLRGVGDAFLVLDEFVSESIKETPLINLSTQLQDRGTRRSWKPQEDASVSLAGRSWRGSAKPPIGKSSPLNSIRTYEKGLAEAFLIRRVSLWDENAH